ncbi:beta-glucoside kinase [Clostridium acetobutylicum]|uniref:Transcriptional regulators of NagC/XylR family n=1 Tax=Clostridium acetobutylicum (strain ATCC 824 / DSM 792 / JCM 1419 / IAM 19013 / LMG 5710 / NBRC 13948 / NRRL B-527 / VKM B-1787 / 2291 / W) TaxID=272562 RepID=Q97K35_CLOAB|nr:MULTISPECIES: ROK family protein [Clostridium]AAK79060.1 Transcriptional regulators of NagC/XylR family [Clostridium acetobutylicum ATCC 824]ADZ20135.1 Transcriptional regulators of NagC/XylR family [Clostridium acetobutylicum EA 2018]AEI33759.1 NagC/XylR family transcriptional regulator [Clostridium acetobutylicum DSM 1731]AWV81685.1 ROK family protein [Clostridium acetobutylicum]MBC2395224.1 ROK family protein [Clostridium acetobutylicum]
MKKYIGFDIGGTRVKHAVIYDNGEIKVKGAYDTNYKCRNKFIEDILKVIKIYKLKYDISGIGISMPGFVNPCTGHTEKAGAIEVMHNQNLKEILHDNIELPIEIDNDANCAALAERYSGNAVNCNDYVLMTVGTGIGGAIITDGKLLYGHNFRGGEIGFMTITEDTDGVKTISENCSTRGLLEEYKKYKNIDKEASVDGREVFEAAREDKELSKIIDAWFERLSRAVFNLAVILNPEKILIGGGISERKDFVENILNHLEKNKYWEDLKVEVSACKHRNDAGIIGSVYKFLS